MQKTTRRAQPRRRNATLSILYLRCAERLSTGELYVQYDTFNSLFEMPAHWRSAPTATCARLSILYLRCWPRLPAPRAQSP